MRDAMRFGFVVHPLSPPHKILAGVRALDPRLALAARAPAGRVARFPSIVSAAGARTAGEVRAIGMLPHAMLRDQAAAVEAIAAAVRRLAADGAGVVGLGSLCAVVGLRGEEVARAAPVPVTTGISFTAIAAVRTLERVADALGEGAQAGSAGALRGRTIAIAGFPGTLATAVAALLARRGARLVLLGGGKATGRVADDLRAGGAAEVATAGDAEAAAAVAAADFVVGASSMGGALDAGWLRPGTVVVDVAEPRDLPARASSSPDVLVVDGENVSLPAGTRTGPLTRIYNHLIGQRGGTVFACFAEPMVLALESRAECFSLGKEISPDRAEEIGELGARHGFVVDRLASRGRPVSAARLASVAALRRIPAGERAA